jgi:hypothetical protein
MPTDLVRLLKQFCFTQEYTFCLLLLVAVAENE